MVCRDCQPLHLTCQHKRPNSLRITVAKEASIVGNTGYERNQTRISYVETECVPRKLVRRFPYYSNDKCYCVLVFLREAQSDRLKQICLKISKSGQVETDDPARVVKTL